MYPFATILLGIYTSKKWRVHEVRAHATNNINEIINIKHNIINSGLFKYRTLS